MFSEDKSKLTEAAEALIGLAAHHCAFHSNNSSIGKKEDKIVDVKDSRQIADLSVADRESHIDNTQSLYFGAGDICCDYIDGHQTNCNLLLENDLDLSDKYIVAHNVVIHLNGHRLNIGGIIANFVIVKCGIIQTDMVHSLIGFNAYDLRLKASNLFTNNLEVYLCDFRLEKWNREHTHLSSYHSDIDYNDINGCTHFENDDVGIVDRWCMYNQIPSREVNYKEHCFDSDLVESSLSKAISKLQGEINPAKNQDQANQNANTYKEPEGETTHSQSASQPLPSSSCNDVE